MNTKKLGIVGLLFISIIAIASILQAATITEPTTFRDRVMFRGSTGPDFDADNKFSIGGTAVTRTADEINAMPSVSGGVSGSSLVATNVSGFAAFATNIVNASSVVTNWTTVLTTNTWYYLDLSTNAATNVVITAVNTPQVAAIALQTRTPAIQQSTITFVSGVCTNKP